MKGICLIKRKDMNNKRAFINLNNVERVKKFVVEVSNFESDVDIIANRYIIDAKSIMGIFSLNLSEPLLVEIRSDDEEEICKFNEIIKDFI